MAITEYAVNSGSIGTTEWSLTTNTSGPDIDTTAGIFQFFLDVSAVAFGDEFELKVYEKVRTASTQRVAYRAMIAGAQPDPVFVTPALVLMNGWDATIVKKAGTDRTLEWSVRKVA